MSLFTFLESWAEGLLRILIGIGLAWIGEVERGGYGFFLALVGFIFIAAGIAEIWAVEAAAHRTRRGTTMNGINPALEECEVPVFYATTYGQTGRIAQRLATMLHEKGFVSRAIDVTGPDGDYVDWTRARAVVVCASVHAHKHQRAAAAFCREYAQRLNARPSVFLSVSLSAASEVANERRQVARIARDFVDACGWTAAEVVSLAGSLAFTKYRWFTRVVMKRIARQHGQPTDTTRDYEFTNWDEVARVADNIVRRIATERNREVA